jgi:hypothetical protein
LQLPSIVRVLDPAGPGMRSICVRSVVAYEIQTGDHVAPLAVEPTFSRL